jgi:excisionase family DNA binding protein
MATNSIAESLMKHDGPLTVRSLASKIGCSGRSLYRLVEGNRIPHYRIETSIRFDPKEVGKWLAAKTQEVGLISFISYEPALGPLSIAGHVTKPTWLIFGGETGAVRRPMDVAWAEQIRDECKKFGVSFFMKQMSARTPTTAKSLIPTSLLIATWPKDGSVQNCLPRSGSHPQRLRKLQREKLLHERLDLTQWPSLIEMAIFFAVIRFICFDLLQGLAVES